MASNADKIGYVYDHAPTCGPILLSVRGKESARNCCLPILQANGLVIFQWQNGLRDRGLTDRASEYESNVRHAKENHYIHEGSQLLKSGHFTQISAAFNSKRLKPIGI
jgi:hypothetical protein